MEPWLAAVTVAHESDNSALNRKGGRENREREKLEMF